MGRVLTYGALAADARARLESHYPEGEARAMTRIIFERLKGFTPADMALKAGDEASEFIAAKVDEVVRRLLADEPIQYIFGIADFYGMEFKVNADVLIPRPETAELVDMIVKDYGKRSDLEVMDICTGSGCIACALARNLPFSRVKATDISDGALAVAGANAKALKVKIDFSSLDALSMPPMPGEFDIIVSNPPYIVESEKKDMDRNVLDNEPAIALFVPDDDPLRFYRPIARFAAASLRPQGALYLEINPLFVAQLRSELASAGFSDVEVIRDSAGRERFIRARL